MKKILLLILMTASTPYFAQEDLYQPIYPQIEAGQYADHLHDQNVHFYYFSQCAVDGFGDIDPFYHLMLDHSDMCNIRELLNKLSSKGVSSLLKNAKSLYSLGGKIERVHPVRFIGYIVSQHDLRHKLRVISETSFKWNSFVKGFGKRASLEMNHGNFYQYLPGFYHSLSHLPVDRNVVNELIHNRNWNGLLHYLITI